MKINVNICAIVLLILCILPIPSLAGGYETPYVVPVSFDFSRDLHWGESGIGYWALVDDSSEFTYEDIEYVGLTDQQRKAVVSDPSAWSKAWLRFAICPQIDWSFVQYLDEQQMDELIAMSGVDYDDPLFLSNIYVQNVMIENATEIGLFPRARMMIAGHPTEMPEAKDAAVWYLEVLIENRGRSDEDIIAAVRQAVLLLDVNVYSNSFVQHPVRIPLTGISRETAFSKENIDFYVEECFMLERIPNFVESTFCPSALPLEVAADAYDHPEDYWIVSIPVWINKRSADGICSITAESHSENTWVFYTALDDIPITVNDTCCAGTRIPISGFVLLMKKEDDTQEALESRLKNVSVDMIFSTEFAGMIYWDGSPEGRNGFVGPRHAQELNMSNCKIEF